MIRQRQRLSIIFAALGALATLGLLACGVLMHYRVLPLEGGISLPLILIFGVGAPVGLLISIVLASPVKGERLIRYLAEMAHVVFLIGLVVNLLMLGNDQSEATWWRVVIFGVLVAVSTAVILTLITRKKNKTSGKIEQNQ